LSPIHADAALIERNDTLMNENQPSATALHVAMQRAAHQFLDDPKVFDDPLALSILGRETAGQLRANPGRIEFSPLSRFLRAFLAARSRLAEDELAVAVERGASQYVIMGAGLDTFAYRNPYPGNVLRVFEVDHPATQAWKRSCLKESGIPLPTNLKFVPVDFTTQTLAEELRGAGFDPGKCTFFSWLGVTEYLTAEEVMATLRFVASAQTGSGIVFNYMVSPSLLTSAQRAAFEAVAQWVASAGEPWKTSFDPGLLTRELRAMGFGHVEDIGPEAINAKYFKDRPDGLRVGSISHVVIARV
jgi:methyltransferase (TIGR00027 family)